VYFVQHLMRKQLWFWYMIYIVLCLEINRCIVLNFAQITVFLLDYNFCSKLLLLLRMNFSPYAKVKVFIVQRLVHSLCTISHHKEEVTMWGSHNFKMTWLTSVMSSQQPAQLISTACKSFQKHLTSSHPHPPHHNEWQLLCALVNFVGIVKFVKQCVEF
jgi:hypothetical protein